MARKDMQRTFATTKVDFSIIENVNGSINVLKQEPKELGGKLDEKQALRALNRIEELKDKNVIVTAVEHDEALYTMPVERFLELATKVSEKPLQTELPID